MFHVSVLLFPTSWNMRRARNNRRGGQRVAQEIGALRRDVATHSRQHHVQSNTISPPSIAVSFRGMRWVRFTVNKPTSGTWYVTGKDLLATVLVGSSSSSSVALHRVRFWDYTDKAVFLDVQVSERPISSSTAPASSGAPLSRYATRGVIGSSVPLIDVEMGRSWKETFLQNSTDDQNVLIAIVVAASAGTAAITVDCLVDFTINLTTFGSASEFELV